MALKIHLKNLTLSSPVRRRVPVIHNVSFKITISARAWFVIKVRSDDVNCCPMPHLVKGKGSGWDAATESLEGTGVNSALSPAAMNRLRQTQRTFRKKSRRSGVHFSLSILLSLTGPALRSAYATAGVGLGIPLSWGQVAYCFGLFVCMEEALTCWSIEVILWLSCRWIWWWKCPLSGSSSSVNRKHKRSPIAANSRDFISITDELIFLSTTIERPQEAYDQVFCVVLGFLQSARWDSVVPGFFVWCLTFNVLLDIQRGARFCVVFDR